MKRVLIFGVVAALCVGLAVPSLARQGRVVETLPKPRAKPTPNAIPPSLEAMRKRYLERLGGAATCDDFMAVATVVDDARPILGAAASQTKSEFETSDAFIERYSSGLASALGGARMLTIRLRLAPTDLTYNADRGLFSVSGYGLRAAVDGIACEQLPCSTISKVDWELRAGLANSLNFKVPSESALATKNASTLVVAFPVNRITTGRNSNSTLHSEFEVAITAGCAVLVSGDNVYPTESDSGSRYPPILTPSAPASEPVRITVALGGTAGSEQVVTSKPAGIRCGAASIENMTSENRQCWMWVPINRPVTLTAQGKGVFGWDWHVAWSGCEPVAEGPACTLVPTDETVVAAVFSVEEGRAFPSDAAPIAPTLDSGNLPISIRRY
jgi:hypothetical protein